MHSSINNYSGFGMKTLKAIINLDFVGKKAELKIASKRRVKTFLGGFLSFLILVLILIGFIYFGQEIVFKQIPSVVQSSVIDDGSKPILIDKENFNFLFSLKDSKSGNYLNLDSDFIQVKVTKIILSKNNSKIGDEKTDEKITTKKINMELVDCHNVYKSDNSISSTDPGTKNKTLLFEGLVNNLNKKNYKCLAQNAQISGSAETKELSYLEISVNSCLDFFQLLAEATEQNLKSVAEKVFEFQSQIFLTASNDTNNFDNYSHSINIKNLKNLFMIKSYVISDFEEVLNNRKICPFTNFSGNATEKAAEITNKNSNYNINKSLISNSLFVLKYIETYFDVRSFSNLANYVIEEYNSKLKTNIIKTADGNLKKIEYLTDKGIVIEDFERTSYTQLTKISETYQNIDGSTKSYLDPLLTFRFNSDKIEEVYYRKYYKAQNLIAELGGLLKSFFTVALILNYFNNHAKYYEKMIDELFDVDDLYKYYQYYNSKNKTIFKKYRDSILLKNSKNMDNFKRKNDNHEANNHFLKTKINHSKDLLEGSLGNLEIV